MAATCIRSQYTAFCRDHVLFWSNLSRLNGLLIIMNISMFFLTGLVARGYYYTCYSMVGLAVIAVAMVIPTRLVRNLGYYLVFLLIEMINVYFLLVSIIYWIQHGG